MARGADIAEFDEKLRLAIGRANLSRAALAQQVGVDKSVVARWLNGAVRPADHSLAALSTLLAQHLPGFSRTDWDLSAAGFAARLGVTPAPAAVAPPPEPSGMPPAAERPGSHAYWLGEARAWAARDGLDEAAERFAGLWLMFWRNLNLDSQVIGTIGEIWRGPSDLEVRWRNGASGPNQLGRRGPAFATGHLLFALNGAPLRNRTFGAMTLMGTERKTAIMDGIMMHPFGPRADRPAAIRTVVLRLADAEPDWAASERRFWAAGREVEKMNHDGWGDMFPAVFAPALAGLQGSFGVEVRPDQSDYIMAEQDLSVRNLSPHLAALRDALLAVRALFAEAIANR